MKNTAITPNLRIISKVKRAVGSAINLLGYEVVRKGHLETLVADLAHCAAMRKIHCNDAVEIEELYHKFVFPDLPRRAGRAELLNELIGTSIGEAIYMIHYLHEAVTLPGDVCEFGVAQGATSALLAAETSFNS